MHHNTVKVGQAPFLCHSIQQQQRLISFTTFPLKTKQKTACVKVWKVGFAIFPANKNEYHFCKLCLLDDKATCKVFNVIPYTVEYEQAAKWESF